MYSGDATEDGLAHGALEHLYPHLGTLSSDAAHIVRVGIVSTAGNESCRTTTQGSYARADKGSATG